MFVINKDDLSIYLTRGDSASITLPITHSFAANDVVRFQVFKKKNCTEVVLRKDFVITEATDSFTIELEGTETKLVDIINKPTVFWYEVEVNPGKNSETIIGYDEDGAKTLTLFPEGNDGIITYEEFVESAYTIATKHGYKGTEEEWLASLKGEKGDKGDKGDKGEAFKYSDFTADQLASLKGEKGDKGDKGDQGIQGIQGIQGEKGDTGAQGIQGKQGEKGDKGEKGDTGNSGVYLGSGDMPADCNVQIDPDGDVLTLEQLIRKVVTNVNKISSVTLLADQWEGTISPYRQAVTISGTTENSKIDLNPTIEQLNIFHNKDIAFVVENNNGATSVYCIGQKPTNDYTIQATITEVAIDG